jgi:hypothetical protein
MTAEIWFKLDSKTVSDYDVKQPLHCILNLLKKKGSEFICVYIISMKVNTASSLHNITSLPVS